MTEPNPTDQYFRTRFTYDEKRDAVWREIGRYLQARYIPPDSRILDLGAGYCHFINNVRGRERHALDASAELPEHAAPGVSAHVRSCTRLENFAADSLDVVFSSNLFEHLTRPELIETLGELRRVLRRGGRLLVVQPNFKYCAADYFDDYTHVQIFTHVGLADLLAAEGFRPLDVRARFLPFSMKSRLPKAALLVRLYLRSPFKPMAGQMLLVAENDK
ncbi:MAG TPA: class I SAM-dependent methyltransferase [Pyrinomonadaceae bacterium]|nr:class I SAM-dependent methyltransferase [Pyrinomonadaceae bacterium]